jgi:hypothetical protein
MNIKMKKIILYCVLIFLFACSRDNSNYKLLIDDKNQPNLIILTDKGNEIVQMNFFDDGLLASVLISDNDRGFNMVINLSPYPSTGTIDSFAFYDELSGYSNSSSYNNGDYKLIRLERFDELLITGYILEDGEATFTASIVE